MPRARLPGRPDTGPTRPDPTVTTSTPHCGRCRTPVPRGAIICPNCGARFVAPTPLKKTVILFALLGAAVASFWMQGSNAPKDAAPGEEGRTAEHAAIAQAQEAVRAKLQDPGAARFRAVTLRERESSRAVCGEVNGANGFQRFVSSGAGEATFLEEQSADFQAVWDKYC